jgi:hypothetical protein
MVDSTSPQVDPVVDGREIVVSFDEARELIICLSNTYISHEDYPLVIQLLRRLRGEVRRERV